ncbi:MAG TPA: hypothetical protein VEY91_11655 [Candidatus Limnocylindria bacterium]|nr:hypothetical protein [Candidatus Limnocylindria bacterium]
MSKARTLTLIVMLALVAAGCDRSPMNPGRGDLAPGLAGAERSAGGDDGCGDLPTAPANQRVDRYDPSFPHPTQVTNPLFPIRELQRVVMLGNSDGEPLRVETTLLPRTKTIRVNGRRVETLVSQYIAWLDGRIHEVALDWYAQDDRGAVWYFGEDVFNYEAGRVADTDGTWLAGRDGPAAMIMPPNPRVGDVWRPENICGVVFEEVIATATGVTVQGPRGPVSGALAVRELHMDGTLEDKTFAPHYGEFSTGSGANLEAVALAVPTDALSGPTPTELKILSTGASKIFRAAKHKNWNVASSTFAAMTAAWNAYRGRGVPPMLEAQMNVAIDELDEALDARQIAAARQASIDVGRASLDFQLQFRPRTKIDVAHIGLWLKQLVVDAAARDRDAVRGDVATIRWIQSRFERPSERDFDDQLSAVHDGVLGANPAAAVERAERLEEHHAQTSGSDSDM